MESAALLTTARWLHQRDANAKTVLWATALVLFMATLMSALVGAILGSFVGYTGVGLVLGWLLPVGHCVKTMVERWRKHREALRALRGTDPALVATVEEWNAELLARGTLYEIRTPRKIQELRVLHKGGLTLTHLDYPAWHAADDPQVEALVKKARPC